MNKDHQTTWVKSQQISSFEPLTWEGHPLHDPCLISPRLTFQSQGHHLGKLKVINNPLKQFQPLDSTRLWRLTWGLSFFHAQRHEDMAIPKMEMTTLGEKQRDVGSRGSRQGLFNTSPYVLRRYSCALQTFSENIVGGHPRVVQLFVQEFSKILRYFCERFLARFANCKTHRYKIDISL